MQDYISKLKDNPSFVEYEKDIIELINGLDSNDGLDTLSDKKAGEEAKLRARCKRLLSKMLEPFFNFPEKREPTEEQVNKAKAKYSL